MSDYEDEYGDDAIEYDAVNYEEDAGENEDEINLEDTFIEAESSSNPIDSYKLIIELEQSNATTYKWSYKSYEKLIQIYIKNKDFPQTKINLQKLFELYPKIDEIDKSDSIREITFVLKETNDINFEKEVFNEMVTLLKEKQLDRVYIETQMKWVKILFKLKRYNEVKNILPEIMKYINKLKLDELLKRAKLELMVMQIQLYKIDNKLKELNSLYLDVIKLMEEQIFDDNLLVAIINEEGGKIDFRNMEYEQALQKFKIAFHNYRESGDIGASHVLKYAFLSSIIVRNRSILVSPEEANAYPQNEELQATVELYNAYEEMNFNLINQIWNEKIKGKDKDEFIIENLEQIFNNIRINYLVNKLKEYSSCKMKTLLSELGINKDLLISMLLQIAQEGDESGMKIKVNYVKDCVDIEMKKNKEMEYGDIMKNFQSWIDLDK